MKPGPELDALIAEKVMGWKLSRYFWDTGTGKIAIERTPKYSTSIQAAWDVVEKLEGELHFKRKDDKWSVFLMGAEVWAGSTQDTLPHAICLAALKAVGYDLG